MLLADVVLSLLLLLFRLSQGLTAYMLPSVLLRRF